jgi:2-desacetyl-2-hydroxyethyl bacteriochlorophyllide A dehydrogenase
MLTASAFWTIGKGLGEIREEPLAPPTPDQVLVETIYSAISRGTERLVFEGRVPQSERERMRAPHQEGSFPFPVKYGYLNVGRVIEGARDLVEKIVFCLYPHQTHFVAAASDVVVLPEGVDPARAVLAGNLETAINGLWDGGVKAGDRVTVVGAGVVGSLVAYIAARIPGCEVELVDVLAERAAVATAFGATFATPERARADRDLVFHASGNPAGLSTAISIAGSEATVVELSWYGDRACEVPLGGAFHSRRLTLRASQVGGVPASQRARWTSRRRLELALSLLTDPTLDVLFDGESPFEDLPAVFSELGAGLCHRIRYPGAR